MSGTIRTPILDGKSGAQVVWVRREDGFEWIEKIGPLSETDIEASVLEWCEGRLPVAKVLRKGGGWLAMSALPGVMLDEAPVELAVEVIAEALRLIHSIPIQDCPFAADWGLRLAQAEFRIGAGLVDEHDFDEENLGRAPADILAELQALPPLPDLTCFTHGDLCLKNLLTHEQRLSGILDLGRAGVTHPAQDWALALRSVHDHFGPDSEGLLRQHLPECCADKELLRQFRLLDELF